ncbi:MAG: arabinose ABC transporter permease, partial [Gammaproteobacteria bacterium]|nr:arabinose ABC transporter permease [Gammaproteobacteria bacterium]
MTSDPRNVRAAALAPFGVRSFRFQWLADLATSWAFEMEVLILGWFVLATTGSVQQLVAFGALAWLGTLFSPFFGVLGDRL